MTSGHANVISCGIYLAVCWKGRLYLVGRPGVPGPLAGQPASSDATQHLQPRQAASRTCFCGFFHSNPSGSTVCPAPPEWDTPMMLAGDGLEHLPISLLFTCKFLWEFSPIILPNGLWSPFIQNFQSCAGLFIGITLNAFINSRRTGTLQWSIFQNCLPSKDVIFISFSEQAFLFCVWAWCGKSWGTCVF